MMNLYLDEGGGPSYPRRRANNLIFVRGSVPGSKNSLVLIHKNSKKTKRTSTLEKIKKFQEESIKIISETKEKKRTTDKKETKK